MEDGGALLQVLKGLYSFAPILGACQKKNPNSFCLPLTLKHHRISWIIWPKSPNSLCDSMTDWSFTEPFFFFFKEFPTWILSSHYFHPSQSLTNSSHVPTSFSVLVFFFNCYICIHRFINNWSNAENKSLRWPALNDMSMMEGSGNITEERVERM